MWLASEPSGLGLTAASTWVSTNVDLHSAAARASDLQCVARGIMGLRK